jgi:hypothetical protein
VRLLQIDRAGWTDLRSPLAARLPIAAVRDFVLPLRLTVSFVVSVSFPSHTACPMGLSLTSAAALLCTVIVRPRERYCGSTSTLKLTPA